MPVAMAPKKATPWTAKRIKALRDRLDLSQAQAAERIGASRATWISWEHGRREPSAASSRLLTLLNEEKI